MLSLIVWLLPISLKIHINTAEASSSWFVDILDHWQTLITGGLAVLAALGTILVMKWQTSIQKDQFESVQRRKAWSAQAKLPDALSAINEYSRAVMAALTSGDASGVVYPTEAVRELKDSIEYIEERAAKRVFELVSRLQVQRARFLEYAERHRGRPFDLEGQQYVYDAVLLTAFTDSLYEFARGEGEYGPTGKPSRKDMMSSLRTTVGLIEFVGDEERFAEVVAMINRRHQ